MAQLEPMAIVSEHTALLPPFDYDPRTRVVFGSGSVDRLGEFARELGGKRVLLVTDQGLSDAGHAANSAVSLEAEGLRVVIFDDVHPNPTTDDVDRCLSVAELHDIDLIVGLGGGSSMDCAKGANFLLSNGGKMEDYWGIGKATKPMLPMIAIPTTAGTGSEAQSFALIANAKTHMKMACGDKKAACRIAILDPDLTVSMPHFVAAATGIDAISHAIETFVTKPRNIVSQLFSRRSWGLLSRGFSRIFESPHDISARGQMQVGSHLAGAAIENSMLGAAHALANPLTAHFGITHGFAVGMMLPHVIRFNAEVVGTLYGKLAVDAGLCEDETDDLGSDRLADFITALLREVGTPTTLDEYHVDTSLLPTLAQEAAKQWTANFNPRPVDPESLEELYRCALSDN
ncbi:MAG: iron-containing alcohol dehydrogenase [Planctomycetota bacterium]|nr:iron-containing alcohol dehydrogenase [Planctomycetota bacterium]